MPLPHAEATGDLPTGGATPAAVDAPADDNHNSGGKEGAAAAAAAAREGGGTDTIEVESAGGGEPALAAAATRVPPTRTCKRPLTGEDGDEKASARINSPKKKSKLTRPSGAATRAPAAAGYTLRRRGYAHRLVLLTAPPCAAAGGGGAAPRCDKSKPLNKDAWMASARAQSRLLRGVYLHPDAQPGPFLLQLAADLHIGPCGRLRPPIRRVV